MWPFTKKPAAPPPDDVVVGQDRAHYDAQVGQWEFVVDGVEFTYSPLTFPPEAFQWAHAEVVHIKRLWHEIDRRVEAYLRDGAE